MRDFPHSVVLQQISSRQPGILVWLLLLFVPEWLPHVITQGFVLWPQLGNFVAYHPTLYLLSFFAVQTGFTCGAICFLIKRYTPAFWTPGAQSANRRLCSLTILIPLLMFQSSKSLFALSHSLSFLRNLPDPNDYGQALTALYQHIWGHAAYGPSLAGVVCYSMFVFISPVLEEMLFSGLMANMLAKRFGITVAILCAPVCFSLSHMVQFGIGPHLIVLFFAGVTYTIMRFYSGNLLMPIIGHMAIQFLISVPKWVVAVMYFKQV